MQMLSLCAPLYKAPNMQSLSSPFLFAPHSPSSILRSKKPRLGLTKSKQSLPRPPEP